MALEANYINLHQFYINLLCFLRDVPYLLVYFDFRDDCFLFLTFWTTVLKEKKIYCLKRKLAKEPIID